MSADAGRREGQPRLSITVPTYNRAAFLKELLECLLPQLAALHENDVELVISDNCSTDDTQQTVEDLQRRGLRCRYERNPENIGSDGNFLRCLNLARGQYAWILGDDDILVPDALAVLLSLLQQEEFDLVYLSSFSFIRSADVPALTAAEGHDKLGRRAEAVTDGAYFLEKVNALLGLISANIVNRNRLLTTPHPPLESLTDSNLLQVGWLFPLLGTRCRVLYVWQRLLAYRAFNSSGWGPAEVFGVRLQQIAARYFAGEPRLARALENGVLRYWLFEKIFQLRSGQENAEMNPESFDKMLRPLFRGNPRYWIFLFPIAELPLPLASGYHRVMATLNKLQRAAQALWRHWTSHGTYLQP